MSYNILFKNSKIFSFEPIPSTYKLFKKNIKVNNLKNVKAYNLGFSNKVKNATLSIPTESQGERYKYYVNHALYSIYGKGKNKIKVKLQTLDKFSIKHDVKAIDFIKIDVEGHELQVLEGAKKIIKAYKPIIQIEYNYISKILTKTKLRDFTNFANKNKFKIMLLGKGFKLIKPNLKKLILTNFQTLYFIKMTIKKVIIQGRGSIGVRHANNLIKLGYYPVFLREKNEKKIFLMT